MLDKHTLHFFTKEAFINKAKRMFGEYADNVMGTKVKPQQKVVNTLKDEHQALSDQYSTVKNHLGAQNSALQNYSGSDLDGFLAKQDADSVALSKKLNLPDGITNVDPGGLRDRMHRLGDDTRFHFTRMGDDVDLVNKAKNKLTSAEGELAGLVKSRDKARLGTAAVGAVGVGGLSRLGNKDDD